MYYLKKIQVNIEPIFVPNYVDQAVPHLSYSPREILEQWVRNDLEVNEHHPTDTFHSTGDVVKDTNLREFEDNFEALEYLAEQHNSSMVVTNYGEAVVVDDVSSEEATPGQE